LTGCGTKLWLNWRRWAENPELKVESSELRVEKPRYALPQGHRLVDDNSKL
jgi:hypothetical protein